MQSHTSIDHLLKDPTTLNDEAVDALLNDQLYSVLDKEDKVPKNVEALMN